MGLRPYGRYYAFVASRDFAQSDESPGKLHLKEVIADLRRPRVLHSADLLVPVMPYKLTWATGVTAVTDYALPLTLKGLARHRAVGPARSAPGPSAPFSTCPKASCVALACRLAGPRLSRFP